MRRRRDKDLHAVPSRLPPWRAILHDGSSQALANHAREFFDIAIDPSCASIAVKLAEISSGPDDALAAVRDKLRDTQLELHRSFALALGGLWERHFRRHLASSLSILGPIDRTVRVEKAPWSELCELFETCRGFPLSEFSSFENLRLLYLVTNAVRHGNGLSTRVLYGSHPHLFSHEHIRNWWSYLALGGEPEDSIYRLEITLVQLRAFTEAIVDFWETIAALHASSEV